MTAKEITRDSRIEVRFFSASFMEFGKVATVTLLIGVYVFLGVLFSRITIENTNLVNNLVKIQNNCSCSLQVVNSFNSTCKPKLQVKRPTFTLFPGGKLEMKHADLISLIFLGLITGRY